MLVLILCTGIPYSSSLESGARETSNPGVLVMALLLHGTAFLVCCCHVNTVLLLQQHAVCCRIRGRKIGNEMASYNERSIKDQITVFGHPPPITSLNQTNPSTHRNGNLVHAKHSSPKQRCFIPFSSTPRFKRTAASCRPVLFLPNLRL